MSDTSKISIRNTNDVEDKSFSDFCDPQSFVSWIASLLYINIEDLSKSERVIIGDSEPKPEDRGKIWISKSGKFISFYAGNWIKIYKYQVNTPFVWIESEDSISKINGLRKLGESEINDYGLPVISGSAMWVIFNP